MSNYVDLPRKDRMKTVFLNENMADVHFLVGLEGMTKERIPGHKPLLATASEAFHGQLYGHFEVPETIDVDDTTPETFKTVLGYIYTLTLGNAFAVLYLAKKYLLSNLVEAVSQFIAIAYNGPNVAKILQYLHLLGGETADIIWQVIENQAVAVLQSQEYLELSPEDLCLLLRRDLNADEVSIFNSVLAWTKGECDRKDLSFAENARAVLGNAIPLIRFPLMTIEEFTDGPVQCGLLTDQVDLTIFNVGSGETLATAQANVTTDANNDIYKVFFDKPALISPGTQYRINASSVGPNSWYATNGQSQVVCQDGEKSVAFTFAADTGLRGPGPYDVAKDGIIPEIYFSFA